MQLAPDVRERLFSESIAKLREIQARRCDRDAWRFVRFRWAFGNRNRSFVPQDRREATGAPDAPILRTGRLLNEQHFSSHVPRDSPTDAPSVPRPGVLAIRKGDVRPQISTAGELT